MSTEYLQYDCQIYDACMLSVCGISDNYVRHFLCQPNICHARVGIITTIKQAFETMMQIFTNMIGKVAVTALLEIVFNSCRFQ